MTTAALLAHSPDQSCKVCIELDPLEKSGIAEKSSFISGANVILKFGVKPNVG